MNLRFLAAVVCLVAGFNSFGQSSKKYNSLFWEITGNGLQKPSYLYGTMHVSNKVAFHLSDSFFIALKNVDQVALETNPEEWMQEIYGKPKNEVEVSSYMPQSTSSFYKNCFYLNIPTNRELKGVFKYSPNIINSLMYRKNEGQDNFEENTYLDLFILQTGKKYGKKIASLEDYTYSRRLVDIANESIGENEEDQISYSKRSKLLKGASYSDVIQDAYRRGDLDLMDSVSKMFYPSKNYNKYMLDVRNEIMVNGMDSIMKKHSLFTGVGAAHLPGEKGVINMLLKKGYKVRPVALNSGLESKFKEEVEKINYPVSFTTFTDPDSLFTVDVPGQMYEVAKTKSYKYYLFPDMVNGCFYLVMTVQNYGALLGVKPADYTKKVDSLLFENIPGKILKKTPFESNNGWKGYDIENVTKRGDYQFYKVIFSPTQLIVVKVNGIGEYAKGAEAQRFFNSVKLHDTRNKTFKKHKFPSCGASVFMPAHIQTETSKNYNYDTYTHFIASGLDENSKQYVFIRSAYHDFKYLEEDTFELNVLAENFCKEQGMKIKTKKLLPGSPYPAVQFSGTYGSTEVNGRIFLSQPFYYLLVTNAKDKNSEAFFNSLQIGSPDYDQPFAPYVDSTLFFKVNTVKMVNVEKRYLSHYEDKKPKTTKKEPEAKKYYFSRTHYFSSPYSGECVMVEANRFSKYSNVMHADTFWAKRAKRYANNGELVLKKKKVNFGPVIQEAWYTYADTNTSQVIDMRVLLKGEMLYVIRADRDSTKPVGKFASEFFRTFEPLDTLMGKDIYSSKAHLFFSDLFSKDKPTNLGAKQALDNGDVTFFDSDDTILLRHIKRPEFHGLSFNAKSYIIRELSVSKSPEMYKELKTLYENYTDSSDIQLVILETMAGLKTEASSKALLDLLINDTPPLNNKDNAMNILYPYFDTLQLASHLFPKLLDLTRYSEYKYAIHKLLAYGVYKNVISKEAYASYKPFLYKECKDELKRQFSSEKETDSYSYKSSSYNGSYEDTREEPAERSIFSSANDNSYFGNDHLYALFILIRPFYEEPAAKLLVEKMQKINAVRTKSTIMSYLLSQGIAFPDSAIKKLAADPESRVYWYKRLQKYGKENLFDKKYLNQSDFAYALVFGDDKLDPKEDTVKFIEKRPVWYKNYRGQGYFYKMKKKNDNNYSIYVSGVFPSDEKKIITGDMLGMGKKAIEKGDVQKELIDDIIQNIRTKNRKRARTSYYYD